MATRIEPVVRKLTQSEAEALLARNQIGRIAFSLRDRVDIEPVTYAFEAPWIFGRTSVGAKLLTLAHNRWCAFETDDVHGLYDWQSVVVKGPFEVFNSAIDTADRYERAVTAIRRVIPEAFGDNDPTPERSIAFGIHASEIEGRTSTTMPAGAH